MATAGSGAALHLPCNGRLQCREESDQSLSVTSGAIWGLWLELPKGSGHAPGSCPVPSPPIPCAATREKPRSRFPFPPSPLPGGPSQGDDSCAMG